MESLVQNIIIFFAKLQSQEQSEISATSVNNLATESKYLVNCIVVGSFLYTHCAIFCKWSRMSTTTVSCGNVNS